jgi:anti-sigma regulatory factor (Ser/Thr protein kinase)
MQTGSEISYNTSIKGMKPTVNSAHGTLYRFPADMASLSAILTQLESLGRAASPAQRQRAATAIEELFTNTVVHGQSTLGTLPQAGLAAHVEAGVLWVQYEDNLQPFDPFAGLNARVIDSTQELDELPVGGLGRLIVRGLSDAASYTRCDGINRIDLHFQVRPLR